MEVSLMMEMIIYSVCGWVMSSYFKFTHPLVLGGGLLIFMCLASGLVCHYGPLFSLSVFLVMAGGILIVFAYTVSLIPFDKEESSKEGDSVGSKKDFKWKGLKFIIYNVNYGKKFSNYKGWVSFSVWVVMVFITTVLFPMESGKFCFSYLSFSNIGYFSEEWAFGVFWIGIFLFFIMISAVGIAGKYKGALIMKG